MGPDLLQRLAAPLAAGGGETLTHRHGPWGLALRRIRPAAAGTGPAARPDGPWIRTGGGAVTAVAGRIHLPADASFPTPPADLDDPLLARSTGAFALVSFAAGDAVPGAAGAPRVTVARDHLGSQPVCYHLDRRLLIAASDPAAILAHPEVSTEVDEAAVADFLGFRFSHHGESFFRGLEALPPGHLLEVGAEDHRVRRYWRFAARPVAADLAPEEAAGELRRALTRAVADEVAGLDPARVAVSLSGGLDSTAVAAVAPPGVRAFSWTFHETPDADESERVELVARHLGLPLTSVPGDGLHPLAGDFVERFVGPGSPHVNPFAALKAHLYETARAEGCHRVLVGDGGDVLYAAREWWLRDLLAHRRPGAAGSALATLARAARGERFARRALGRLLPDGPRRTLGRWLRPGPEWLTPLARRRGTGRTRSASLPTSPILPSGPHRHRHELAVGAKHSVLESEESRLFTLCGVERANPFWSWPLLETAIQLPAYLYHRDGRDKVLSRLVLRGLLPPEVVDGPRGGLLGGVFLAGLEANRALLHDRVLRNPRSDWPRYVRREWLEGVFPAASGGGAKIGFSHTILWRVICYELWRRRLAGDLGSW